MNQGLIALANAASKGWFWGHYGASYLAAQFYLEEIENTILMPKSDRIFLSRLPSTMKIKSFVLSSTFSKEQI